MDLHDFVKNILTSLDKAVESARSETKRDIRFSDDKDHRTVEFDIAISVESSDTRSGKAGIRVLQFAEAGGDISKESKNSTVSRVQFGVHIGAMTKDEEFKQRAEIESFNSQQMDQDPY